MTTSDSDQLHRHLTRPVVVGLIALLVFGGVIGIAGVAAAQDGTAESHDQLSVTVLNVGQGDAIVLQTQNEVMVIDSGPWQDDGQTVINELRSENISHIDHLVATHSDSDHIGGHAEVINEFETNYSGVGAVYDSGLTSGSATYEDYSNATETHNVTLYEVREGDMINFSSTHTEVLNPQSAPTDSATGGVVLHVQENGYDYLFTGDLEAEGETRLVEEYNLSVDVLKLGHHGSDTSTTTGLLDEFEPRIGLISSSATNAYGHPSNATLERLDNRSIPVTWTATHGTHEVTTGDGEIRVYAQNPDAPTAPLNVTNAAETTIDPLDPLDLGDPAVVVGTEPAGGPALLPDEPIVGGVPNALIVVLVALGAVLIVGDST